MANNVKLPDAPLRSSTAIKTRNFFISRCFEVKTGEQKEDARKLAKERLSLLSPSHSLAHAKKNFFSGDCDDGIDGMSCIHNDS